MSDEKTKKIKDLISQEQALLEKEKEVSQSAETIMQNANKKLEVALKKNFRLFELGHAIINATQKQT